MRIGKSEVTDSTIGTSYCRRGRKRPDVGGIPTRPSGALDPEFMKNEDPLARRDAASSRTESHQDVMGGHISVAICSHAWLNQYSLKR